MNASNSGTPSVEISAVRIEHLPEFQVLGTDRPRLSWELKTQTRGWYQAGYQMECYDADGKILYQTGRINSHRSILVDWPFKPLASRECRTLRIKVWGRDGQESAWSKLISIEAGLLLPEDWTARFITPAWDEDITRAQPAPFLRREFEVRTPVKLARLYITALGVYEAQLNGAVIGDHVMDPGWTSYHHRLQYQTFDITNFLHIGYNAIGVILGDGWFRGRLGFDGGRRNIYGNKLGLLAQIELIYADNTSETITTDQNWRAATGPILSSDIYDGEIYDARLELPGWSTAGFPDGDWKGVRPIEWNISQLEAPLGPPVRRIETIEPISIQPLPTGRILLDFGQNLVGRLRINVQGPPGHTITLRHAEVLENGELCTRPLRTAKATDRYTLRGSGMETWEPRFTFHGFRYAEIDGWPGRLSAYDIQAVVCHSDMQRTGWFDCSDPFVNRLHENVVWSMRGNFFDIPTDCPQRDERMGWAGDIQVFAPAASFLYDACGFLSSWLRDLVAEQKQAGGIVPPVIPNILDEPVVGAAAWGDAAVIVPWVLYQRYGDQAILESQFGSMRAWVDWITTQSGEKRLWDRGVQYGDWLDPTAPPDRPDAARTDRYLIATAYFAHSAELTGCAADVLGFVKEKEYYLSLAHEIRQAFARKYITPSGYLSNEAQTAYSLAIEFCLLTDLDLRQNTADRLIGLVRKNNHHIGTGFVGTPLICDALCTIGQYSDAYQLLLQQECPSWLYPVTMGATTIWERWDSMLPDGSINLDEMTSFNHYALGAVADWIHRTIGGLAPAEPGYRLITIRPIPGGGINRATARHITPYGIAECNWEIVDSQIKVDVIIPPNTTAVICLPSKDKKPLEVGSGTYSWLVEYYPFNT